MTKWGPIGRKPAVPLGGEFLQFQTICDYFFWRSDYMICNMNYKGHMDLGQGKTILAAKPKDKPYTVYGSRCRGSTLVYYRDDCANLRIRFANSIRDYCEYPHLYDARDCLNPGLSP